MTDAFLELMEQNVREMPPGSLLAWRKLLTYTGSCFRRGFDDFFEPLVPLSHFTEDPANELTACSCVSITGAVQIWLEVTGGTSS